MSPSATHVAARQHIADLRELLGVMELPEVPGVAPHTLADVYAVVLGAADKSVELHEIMQRRHAELRGSRVPVGECTCEPGSYYAPELGVIDPDCPVHVA